MAVLEIKNNNSSYDKDLYYKKMLENVTSYRCPYCKMTEWNFTGELESIPEIKSEISICKNYYSKPVKFVKLKCRNCGYTAYFHE